LAMAFAAGGAKVAITARRRDALERVAAEIEARGGLTTAVVEADLSTPGAAADVAARATEALGGVDVLVNNAGGGGGGVQWAAGDRDEVREIFEVNVWSPLALISALVPAMRARKSGAVINVTSIAQVSTWPSIGHYAASKAALASFTETLHLELLASGVHVMQVIPGPVDTPAQGESRLIGGFEDGIRGVRLGDPDVLADRVIAGLAKRRRRLVYPRSVTPLYTLPGLVRAFTPRRVTKVRDKIDIDDNRVRRSGSFGDEYAVAAREAWERGERDLSDLRKSARQADSGPRD
jgi:uncharacterized protein